jgi:hypothetical protein
VPFTDSTKAQDKPASPGWRVGLIRMGDYAWIEKRGGFERIFMQKIGANELSLDWRERRVTLERVLHFIRAVFKDPQKISMSSLEVFEHVPRDILRGAGV